MFAMIDYEQQSILLLSEYKNTGQKECLQQLYILHKNLFYRISSNYKMYMELEDLLQECFFALLKAVEGFQEEKGSFTKYLAKVTQSHLYRYTQKDSLLPAYMATLIKSYNAIMSDLAGSGITLNDKQLAYKLEISEDTLKLLYKAMAAKSPISLNTPIDEDDVTLIDITPSEYNLEDSCINDLFVDEVQERVNECIKELSEEDQELIKKRYIEEMTLAEIDPTKSIARNRQRTDRAFKRLQKIGKIKLARLNEEYIYYKGLKGVGVNTFMNTWTSSTERIILNAEKWNN